MSKLFFISFINVSESVLFKSYKLFISSEFSLDLFINFERIDYVIADSVLSSLWFIIAIAISGAVDESVIVIVDLPFIVIVPNVLTFILSAFTVVLALVPFLHKLLIT